MRSVFAFVDANGGTWMHPKNKTRFFRTEEVAIGNLVACEGISYKKQNHWKLKRFCVLDAKIVELSQELISQMKEVIVDNQGKNTDIIFDDLMLLLKQLNPLYDRT